MSSRLPLVAAVVAGLTGAVAAPAGAQTADERPSLLSRMSFGVEAAANLAPADPDAFFNYTDYERDALRIARVRLLAQWRARRNLSFVTEVRTENATDLRPAAYYVRWTPVDRHDLTIQAGRIPPVVGAFPRRAYGRDNLVVGAPLAFQYLISLRPDALPASVDDLLRMRGRGWQPSYPIGAATLAPGVPLVSASRWDPGVEAHWRRGRVDVAGAVTLGSAAVPLVRDTNRGRQYSMRAGVAIPSGPALGVSASQGDWVESGVLAALPAGTDRANGQRVLAVDAEYGRGAWLIRAESVRARFEVPVAGALVGARVSAWASFGEARYRFHPRWQTAIRVEHMDFSRLVRPSDGASVRWEAPVRRVEAILAFRASRTVGVRAGWQHNWRDGGRVSRRGVPMLSVLWWY